ncbi:hypothetical protein [Streptomyces sp. NBC_01435]|uniref:hypothetical protein n=1 Tax=Streptomyces sp. NBC_01435 TaxID=2903865 RepID=UPI002E3383EB|nr:hypothetical protein [Streptomyces sp. NBC_01435]
MNQIVYLLVHRHHISLDPDDVASDFMEGGEPLFWDDSEDDFKVLGLYSSRQLAEERIERARSLPGFRRSPEGFFLHEYTVGEAHWPHGFRASEGVDG